MGVKVKVQTIVIVLFHWQRTSGAILSLDHGLDGQVPQDLWKERTQCHSLGLFIWGIAYAQWWIYRGFQVGTGSFG